MPDSSIDKTLIIRFSSVGDIVLTTQLVRALRRRFPHSRVDYLVKAEYADLLRHNPHLSRLIEFPAHGKLLDLLQLRKSIRADAYDLVIDVHNSIRSRILCAGMRNVVRIRKRTIARFALVRFKRDIYGWFGGSPPVARRYLDTVKRFGVEDDGLGPELDVPPVAITRALQRNQMNSPVRTLRPKAPEILPS